MYIYSRIAQGLIGALYTYYYFIDLAFSQLLVIKEHSKILSLISDTRDAAFEPFINNYNIAVTGYKVMFKILYTKYFPRYI